MGSGKLGRAANGDAQWGDCLGGVDEVRRAVTPSGKNPPAVERVSKELADAVVPVLERELVLRKDALLLVCVWAAGLLVFGLVAPNFINLNRFSLHGTFRNRLVRAYLGASRPGRDPNPFTGFDERDNFAMAGLKAVQGNAPLHVINMTLNLASPVGRQLSWQDRKAESFIVSPLFSGSRELGFRDTKRYGGLGGITVGTAVTISGAAVSPNMGYHTSPILSFLLTLFNVRLGAWLGNPGREGGDSYQTNAPTNGAKYVIMEAFGLADATRPYVFLSDGGHFENLGLYEMVRRRSRLIIVCDGSADPDYGFEDLANAVRKIRIDFGIPITFDPTIAITRADDKDVADKRYCALGNIQYTCVDPKGEDGCLIYVKPAFYKTTEPVDVKNYAIQSTGFPQETTANQFFTESQFESYRALGAHIFDDIQKCKAQREKKSKLKPAGTLAEFVRRVKEAFEEEKKQSPPAGPCAGGAPPPAPSPCGPGPVPPKPPVNPAACDSEKETAQPPGQKVCDQHSTTNFQAIQPKFRGCRLAAATGAVLLTGCFICLGRRRRGRNC